VEELNAVAPLFIKACDGLSDPKEIYKNKRKIKEKKSAHKNGKVSTYSITLDYIKKDMSLAEIAKERGITEGTVSGHLIKIRKDNPDLNLDQYKPKDAIISSVRKIYDKQKKGEPISTKTIYDALKGKVSYNDIKLAIAFL
jgi:uncharacterized protein YpbB